MKKHVITIVAALLLSLSTYAQSGLNLGVSIGFPYENYEGYDYSFAFNIDANYLFEVNSAFNLGFATGYGQAFGEDFFFGPINFETPDYQYVPLAAAARFNLNSRLVFGADVGYALSVSSAKDGFNRDYYTGGFYWRPMVGFNLNDKMQLNINYIGISDDYFYYSAFNLGFMVNLN
ncbi:outer membrane beta-barrel protein [Hanstruepera ponticola]|uniref:outer membrane beta-barrel protein n=1 Tax=Hanstruepera ponticola TaxID=2042995 RepID=UPI000CF0DA29|nr:outer membrane beta-barrel protein [Hanstruepera ponticola]